MASLLFFKRRGKLQLKICKKCGVVVEDDTVFICPKCGAGRLKKKSQKKSKELLMSVDGYYNDVLPEDAGQVEQKQNNTGLYVKIAFIGFVVAVIVSACAVVAFMM